MKWFSDSSGKAFGFDGRIHFRQNAPRECEVCPKMSEIDYSILAAYSLSGVKEPLQVVWSDGNKMISKVVCMVMGRFGTFEEKSGIKKAVCGPVCSMPDKLSELCKGASHDLVYVCPLVSGLVALGMILSTIPEARGKSIVWPNLDTLELPCQEFDENLDGDGYGRMAYLVSKGMSVLNQMMIAPADLAFHNRVLSMENREGAIYLIRRVDAANLFENEPIQIREYASSTVPIEMNNTDKFRKMTGCTSDRVTVMVSSSCNQGMSDFLRFLKVVSGKCWVRSYSPSDFKFKGDNMPTFRYHGGYNISEQLYGEICDVR